MRPPASARESMRRLLVMKDCMRALERDWVLSGLDEEEGEEADRPLHSGRKTGREVIR